MTDEATGGVQFTGETGPGDAGHAVEGGATPDFFSMIPEEYKEATWVTKYDSPDEFFKGINNMAEFVGKKVDAAVRPGEGATDEDWKNFYSKIGVPEDPTGYALTVDSRFKELFLEGDDKAVANMFHAANLTPEQAQALLPAYLEYRQGQTEQYRAAQQEQYKAAETALKNEWGPKYEEKLISAAKGLDKAGVFEELEKMGLGNNPAIIKLGEVLNRALGEDYQREGDTMSQQATLASLESELDEITANPKFQRDNDLKEKAFELSKKINGMKRNRGSGGQSIPAFSAR